MRFAKASEVEPGLLGLYARCGHRVDVALPQQDVALALQLDLGPILRVEENAITDLNLSNVLTGRHHGRPRKPLPHAGRRWDHESAASLTLAHVGLRRDEHAVMQHPDRQAFVARAIDLRHDGHDGDGEEQQAPDQAAQQILPPRHRLDPGEAHPRGCALPPQTPT